MSRHIVIEGNLTRDPTGGYGKDTGKAYTHLDIAVTDRVRNTQGDWVDGPVTYYRVTAFGKTAENATNSLTKGNTVIVTGQLTVRSYARTDGTPGIAQEIIADHLGAALTYTTVTIDPKNAAQTS
jgi:single-strand DNA-binding protein